MSEPDHPGAPHRASHGGASPPRPEAAYHAVRQRMHEQVNLGLLPPPPASAVEWRGRAIRLCHDMPGMRDELGNVPIGWFSLVERAVVDIRRHLLPGEVYRTRQLKEKFGTLRWYGHVEDGAGEAVGSTGADGAADWAEDASAIMCAVFGTPDGRVDTTGGWLLTLSDRASAMRHECEGSGIRGKFTALMYPRWED